ncbi:YybH family protein [Tengunoibacter tsumagoiensis]|uniref:DUF4440 domain-containing protein n=1 Tax=Tengunoibacter tsumagoiensis TaxID=2014871 RepID=A0A402A1G6_9CHLR|nr:nuclear transport factor 2 family protein [Tengunoibacter tsumagoiensis]GCE12905.1 hypothetical protein KTT_27640 [Tengunoibacter tsumagoiensis]
MNPEEFLQEYIQKNSAHDYDEIAPLISEHATYWFSEGTYCGREEIRAAFETTWAVVKDEHYWIDDIKWLIQGDSDAVCIYHFYWKGTVGGSPAQGKGRGTNVFQKDNGQWYVIHEHLSSLPQ